MRYDVRYGDYFYFKACEGSSSNCITMISLFGSSESTRNLSLPTQFTDPSVIYFIWGFTSNSDTNVGLGAWVDSISITGTTSDITAAGQIQYSNRNNGMSSASNMRVELYEYDSNGSKKQIGNAVVADENGNFSFPTFGNWDDDPDDGNPRVDLIVYYYPVYHKGQNDEQSVRRLPSLGSEIYYWYRMDDNVSADYNLPWGAGITIGWDDSLLAVIWAYEDMLRAYKTFTNMSINPGSAVIRWESGMSCYYFNDLTHTFSICDTAFYLPGIGPNGVYLSDYPQIVNSADTIVHEVLHQYMDNSIDFWYPYPGGFNSFYECVITGHTFTELTTQICAYTEGWADFGAVVINRSLSSNDNCYDFGNTHCSGYRQSLETPSIIDDYFTLTGDTSELRVTTALWDLFDSLQDGNTIHGDRSGIDFSKIVAVQRTSGDAFTFAAFWNKWKELSNSDSTYNKHLAVQTLFYNRIDYNNLPVITSYNLGLLRDSVINFHYTIPSCNMVYDEESTCLELTTNLLNSTTCANVSLDANKNIHISIPAISNPTSEYCEIDLLANDGNLISPSTGTIHVTIDPVVAKLSLPIIMSTGSTANTIEDLLDVTSSDGVDEGSSAYPAPIDGSSIDNNIETDSSTADNNPLGSGNSVYP